jgi:hypothetical protein
VAAVCLVTSGPAQKVSRVPLFLRAVQAPHSAAPVYCDTMLSLATAWDTLADLHCPAVAVADTVQRRMEAHAARHERIERARSQMRDVLGVCPLPRERERERGPGGLTREVETPLPSNQTLNAIDQVVP